MNIRKTGVGRGRVFKQFPKPNVLSMLVCVQRFRYMNRVRTVRVSKSSTMVGSRGSVFSNYLPMPTFRRGQPVYLNLQLRDFFNHLVRVSQTHFGSIFIQQQLEQATAEERQMVFNEIIGAAYYLMRNSFGNYVVQKFFVLGTPEQKAILLNQVKGRVLPLAFQQCGCRVLQKALETISSSQRQEIAREFDGYILQCISDANANHVVQKCIVCVEPGALQFMISAFKGRVYSLCTHVYGCRIIQRIFEHFTPEQVELIMDEVHTHSEELMKNEYGNYVMQHILENGKLKDKLLLNERIRGNIFELSQEKFASNVVERYILLAARAERTSIIDEVCAYNDRAFGIMVSHQFANYVIQTMMCLAQFPQLEKLMSKISCHRKVLSKYTYGRLINAEVEKFYMTSSNQVGSSMIMGFKERNGVLGPIGRPKANKF